MFLMLYISYEKEKSKKLNFLSYKNIVNKKLGSAGRRARLTAVDLIDLIMGIS